MRILMCAGFYDVGGFSTVMEKLAIALAEKGHEVTIGALHFKHLPVRGPFVVAKIPANNFLKLKNFLKCFEIIHNHHPMTNYLSLISPCPFVYHYHGAPNFISSCSLFSSIRLTGRHIDAVIAISDESSYEAKRHFPSSKIHVIYNGVDTQLFRPGLGEKFRKGTPEFLFVGNLYKHKNLEELILALKEISNHYPKCHLLIVGTGQMFGRLKKLVANLRLDEHVDLVGRVPVLELPYYYSSCDVYVTPSRWELFGLPLLEAMACGKPVVASAIPAHIDLVMKSKAGAIYSGNFEMCKTMVSTYEKRNDYTEYALNFAKEHDWSMIAEQVLAVYGQVCVD